MRFSDIADVFDRLEGTGSRLEMASILSEFFALPSPEELRSVIYLSQGRLHPEFCPQEFGMADRLVLKAISFTSGATEAETEAAWLREGDAGSAAEALISRKKQTTLFSEPLSLDRVLRGLGAIESAEGRDSQEKKMKLLANLLHDSGPAEARYLCRIVSGKMRVGAASMTVLDALALAFAEKGDRPAIERAFNVTCDLGYVAEVLAEDGMEGIAGISVSVGSPIKAMLAERLPSIAEVVAKMGGECAMEYKYDGIRVQAHISPRSVKLFSRRLEDLTGNFPDIAESLRRRLKGREAIVEGECVAVDPETGFMQPFQTVTHRRRKHGMDSAVKEVAVRMFLFDILYIDGRDMTVEPYPARRALLSDSFEIGGEVQLSTMRLVHSTEEAEAFFDVAMEARCEGVMAKSVSESSVYRAGSRGFLWIKYKRDYRTALTDTFDLAVVGAFYGMGKRAGRYGALLMAAYDRGAGRYATVCKLGTGFDDAFLDGLPALLDGSRSEAKPALVDAKMEPDVWFEPAVVLEVVGAELSVSPVHTAAMGAVKEGAGIGIRFPRFTGRVREDKGPEQATSASEILEMYEMQSHDSDGLDAPGERCATPSSAPAGARGKGLYGRRHHEPMELHLVEKNDDSVTIRVSDADPTLIMPVIDRLNANPDVEYVRYAVDHPELTEPELCVKMNSGSPTDAIVEAARGVSEFFSKIEQ